jgi:hypothetical protein
MIVTGSLLGAAGLGLSAIAIVFGRSSGTGSGAGLVTVVIGAYALAALAAGTVLLIVGLNRSSRYGEAVERYRRAYGEDWERTAPQAPQGRPGLGKIITGGILAGVGFLYLVTFAGSGSSATSSSIGPVITSSVALIAIGAALGIWGILQRAETETTPVATASIGYDPATHSACFGLVGRF